MTENMPEVAIILLNWNGKEDTLACISSIAGMNFQDYGIILVDNASQDGSMDAVRKEYSHLRIEIIENEENLGFAAGNNIGITYAMEKAYSHVLLLNNDTVVHPDFLNILLGFSLSHPEYSVLCPQIRYYEKGEMIWNCGGRLTAMGAKKYFYEGETPDAILEKESMDITFITGCALFASTSLFKEHGLLSEDFFFGEEDYEFSLRIRQLGKRMACVVSSIIWHKVSSSVSRASNQGAGKILVHYLNRFINMKNFMPKLKWRVWRRLFLLYIQVIMVLRYHIPLGVIYRFSRTLMKESAVLSKVDKLTFEKYFSFNFKSSNS